MNTPSRMRTVAAPEAVAILCLCFAVSAGAEPSPSDVAARRSAFAYDAGADLGVRENGAEPRGDALVRDISFLPQPGAQENRVGGYLVAPRSGPVRAAILWVHWLGEPATTNRSQFLDEAVALASPGAVSLLVNGMWSRPHWHRDRVLDDDYENSVAQVIALRRALDLLQRQPGAAEVSLAIVGHDYGGMYAAIAAGVDQRAATCVFIACTASLLDWAFYRAQPASMEAYRAENLPLELVDHLAANPRATMLFQFAEHDNYVPLESALKFFAAARTSKQMIVYGGADHSMTTPASIRADRHAWLQRQLGLERPTLSR